MEKDKCSIYTSCTWCDCYDFDTEQCIMPSQDYTCPLEDDMLEQDKVFDKFSYIDLLTYLVSKFHW